MQGINGKLRDIESTKREAQDVIARVFRAVYCALLRPKMCESDGSVNGMSSTVHIHVYNDPITMNMGKETRNVVWIRSMSRLATRLFFLHA